METEMIDRVLNSASTAGTAAQITYEFEDQVPLVPNHRAIFVTIFAAFFAVLLSKSKCSLIMACL